MNARRADGRSGPRSRTGRGPIRTCIGCRERAPDTDLLRVVLSPDGTRAVPDPRRSAPGRGAWVHPQEGCISAARDRRAFVRALRAGRAVSTDAVSQVRSVNSDRTEEEKERTTRR